MGRLWDYCAFCGKRIETGEMCYGLPNGKSVCTDCCVEENEGAAVSNDEEEQEDDNCPNCGAMMDGGDDNAAD